MNSHPDNLAAWLDDELDQAQANAVTAHVEHCAECRARAAAYAEVTRALLDLRPAPRRRSLRLWFGAAAAAAAALLVVALWPRQAQPPVVAQDPAPEPRIAEPSPRPVAARPEPARPHRITPASRRRLAPTSRPSFDGPVIRVALPADALFAPGAVPRGAAIYADLTLAADGSLRQLRLLP